MYYMVSKYLDTQTEALDWNLGLDAALALARKTIESGASVLVQPHEKRLVHKLGLSEGDAGKDIVPFGFEDADREASLWCDGGASPNPGLGSWAWRSDRASPVASGVVEDSTNQRMELTAAIQALKGSGCRRAIVHSDSEYLVKGMSGWLAGWKARGWKNAKGQPVANQDLWRELDRLASLGRYRWVYTPDSEAGLAECHAACEAARHAPPPRT